LFLNRRGPQMRGILGQIGTQRKAGVHHPTSEETQRTEVCGSAGELHLYRAYQEQGCLNLN
jgi:hypothetical protein